MRRSVSRNEHRVLEEMEENWCGWHILRSSLVLLKQTETKFCRVSQAMLGVLTFIIR